MNQAGHRGMHIFSQRVFHHACKWNDFCGGRNHLPAYRIGWVARVDQGSIVGGDFYSKKTVRLQCFLLTACEREYLFEIFNRVQTVAQLPVPIVPFFIRNILVGLRSFRGKSQIFHFPMLLSVLFDNFILLHIGWASTQFITIVVLIIHKKVDTNSPAS